MRRAVILDKKSNNLSSADGSFDANVSVNVCLLLAQMRVPRWEGRVLYSAGPGSSVTAGGGFLLSFPAILEFSSDQTPWFALSASKCLKPFRPLTLDIYFLLLLVHFLQLSNTNISLAATLSVDLSSTMSKIQSRCVLLIL